MAGRTSRSASCGEPAIPGRARHGEPQVIDEEKEPGRSPLVEPRQEVDQAIGVDEAFDDLESHFAAVGDGRAWASGPGPQSQTGLESALVSPAGSRAQTATPSEPAATRRCAGESTPPAPSPVFGRPHGDAHAVSRTGSPHRPLGPSSVSFPPSGHARRPPEPTRPLSSLIAGATECPSSEGCPDPCPKLARINPIHA